MTTSYTGIDVAGTVLRALLAQQGHEEPSRREARAIDIVAAFGLRDEGRDWYVQASSGGEYRIRRGDCPCPDARGGQRCKHLLTVDLLDQYARELARRLGRDEWDGTVDHARTLHEDYLALLQAAAGYRPPPEGLLTAFSLEAIGDDAWQAQRQARFRGQMYRPGRLRDLHPERPWVAALNGLDVRYEFARGFLRGKVDYRDADKRGSRSDRIAATVRHNRARGKHGVEAMSKIVMELWQRNWSAERIAKELGMEADEVLRLRQVTGLAELFANREFSEAWDVVPRGRADG